VQEAPFGILGIFASQVGAQLLQWTNVFIGIGQQSNGRHSWNLAKVDLEHLDFTGENHVCNRVLHFEK